MSTFVESLKRLYQAEKITLDKIKVLYSVGKITKEEYDYICD